ncbi:PBAN-type neuropeptides-like [Linepithema humile]|uniref:PBAN-type neuropeptides-like n=1 Tax=Linepithema humile TaxID=83485 RepID=UPI0006232D0C|nr:PREDICTED: PBAN-type neuropeptides-like [Linepithema humile]
MIITRNRINRATLICVLASWLCLASRASAEYESREMSNGGPGVDASCIEGKCMKRTATQDATASMWFGPRLGRRRRSDEKQEVNSEIQALAEALDSGRLALFAIPANDKRQPTQFTPRLGRGSDEDLSSYGDAIERNEIDDRILPALFAPRLGRRIPWSPSPRLGRQLRSILRKM